ncbi:Translation initiation factor 3 subunit b [Tulasnella sp. JGI-2019a]|nr:Translation initiation factor 3 subunit b [Tulasnella sp. JGI-2019a]KAG9034887.1 Translation initiation factor 3 subunit b [Tulasnella sp. JGI-2019a]
MASTSKVPDNEGIDYTDIEEKYQVSYEDGFDNVLVVDNVPIVDSAKRDKLLTAITKKFTQKAAPIKPGKIHLPFDDKANKSKGYIFVEFKTNEEATYVATQMNGVAFDTKHTFVVNRFTDIEKFATLAEKYVEPEIPPYTPQEHLRWWLADGRDQFLTYRDQDVAINWHNKNASDVQTHRKNWTDLFAAWSPLGTYLASLHRPGVRLWAGGSWNGIARFAHPLVKLLDFSPCENYLVTWSQEPISPTAGPPGPASFTEEDEGNNIAVWDVKTGHLLRTFQAIPELDSEGQAKKMSWPLLKWSPDDKYVARIQPGVQISVYELPGMGLLDKKSIKIDGVVEFDWCPSGDVDSDEKGKASTKKARENFFAYWQPEIGDQPAKVTLLAIPSRTSLRTKNLFNVADCKLHWHNQGDYLCVKVDRFTKTKKSIYCNLEIVRTREKDFPVEVVEIKETVTDFAWEPRGERFAVVTSMDPNLGNVGPGITIKTDIFFYQLDKTGGLGTFKLLKKLMNKTANTMRWSPKGRHIVLATVGSSSKFDLEFWDLDFFADRDAPLPGKSATGGPKEKEKEEWGSNAQLVATTEHYGVTDIEWDPSGRFVATSASVWRHTVSSRTRLRWPVFYGCRICFIARERVHYLGFQGTRAAATDSRQVQTVPMAPKTEDAPVEGATAKHSAEAEGVQQGVRRGGCGRGELGEQGVGGTPETLGG